MTFDLCVISLSERAVQVALEDGSPAFWLPRQSVEWRGLLEPGEMVTADVPRWLASKHSQLVASRTSTQKVLALDKAELDPVKSQEPIPMADNNYPADCGKGTLNKNREKSKPSQPDYYGSAELELDGRTYTIRIAAWIKDSQKHPGQKFMSLSFRPDEQQQPAKRAQRSSSDPVFDDSTIPF